MGKISIIINEYKVEGLEFRFLDGGAVVNFTIGLYDEGGHKITSVTFSNKDMGLPFKPDKKINLLLRELLIALDSWVEHHYLPQENSSEESKAGTPS